MFPGAAAKFVKWVEDQGKHRRKILCAKSLTESRHHTLSFQHNLYLTVNFTGNDRTAF